MTRSGTGIGLVTLLVAGLSAATGATPATAANERIPGVEFSVRKNCGPRPCPRPAHVATFRATTPVAGATVQIRGRVTGATAPLRIALQGRAGGRWVTFAGPARSRSNGLFELVWRTPHQGGAVRVRVVVLLGAGDGVRAGSRSFVVVLPRPGAAPVTPAPADPVPAAAPPQPPPVDTGAFTVTMTASVCKVADGFRSTVRGTTATVRPGAAVVAVLIGPGSFQPQPQSSTIAGDGTFASSTTVSAPGAYQWAVTITAADGTQQSQIADVVMNDAAHACP